MKKFTADQARARLREYVDRDDVHDKFLQNVLFKIEEAAGYTDRIEFPNTEDYFPVAASKAHQDKYCELLIGLGYECWYWDETLQPRFIVSWPEPAEPASPTQDYYGMLEKMMVSSMGCYTEYQFKELVQSVLGDYKAEYTDTGFVNTVRWADSQGLLLNLLNKMNDNSPF